MEKDRFLFLTQHYTSLSKDEAEELDDLQKDYPYSQVIHNLATRGAHDNQLDSYQRLLQVSAVYTTDRVVLKQVMMEPRSLRVEFITNNPEKVSAPEVKEGEPEAVSFTASPLLVRNDGLTGDALIDEVKSDLIRLKELREKFEYSLEEYEKVHENPTPIPLTEPKRKKIIAAEQISDLDKHELLMEEIKNSKKEIDPEGETQKIQSKIIDEFIKTAPSITKGKAIGESPADLAESNSAFSDHIISETLVDLLLKQGKTEKAVEVLRKLIWKFPQKKAIFAAQIESLRK